MAAWSARPLREFLTDASLGDAKAYDAYRRSAPEKFFFSPRDRSKFLPLLQGYDNGQETATFTAERILAGEFLHFSFHRLPRGLPPDWQLDPFSGSRIPADRHWSEMALDRGTDIKLLWELNRFSFVYPLVRAYWRSGREEFADVFWALVESWRAQNPPQAGPNWACGQEISFRVMALVFGLYGFGESPASTPERVCEMAQMMAIFGERIEAHIPYALSQDNNHGMSEALGLWTIGTLFPELRRSRHWQRQGRKFLEELGRKLIYDGGGFSQCSANYHRLMLHDYLWYLRLSELNHVPISAELRDRIGRATELLGELHDPISGRIPNFGQNDGALVLPLNNCDFQDFRPVIQAATYLSRRRRCHDHGPWDEDLLWLFGPDSFQGPVETQPPREGSADAGAGCSLRSPNSMVFLRFGRFRHRPSHADLLHVDLWWKGWAVATDAGTYSYDGPAPWSNPLAHTEYHNTVTVDGRDQMDRVGKFLWLPWANSCKRADRRALEKGKLHYLEADHDGYQRLRREARHRRAVIQFSDQGWMVLDRLESSAPHVYRVQWLLSMAKWSWSRQRGEVVLDLPGGSYHVHIASDAGKSNLSLVSADPTSPRGWVARYYRHREPALSLALSIAAESAWVCTCFSADPVTIEFKDGIVEVVATTWSGGVTLLEKSETLASAVRLKGPEETHLQISE
jgi:asparagine synthase (glutamine-hydrolysing)